MEARRSYVHTACKIEDGTGSLLCKRAFDDARRSYNRGMGGQTRGADNLQRYANRVYRARLKKRTIEKAGDIFFELDRDLHERDVIRGIVRIEQIDMMFYNNRRELRG